ncbi:MAG: hypothetical protein AB7R89_28815 [Dehalococcoidia bacterium]
MQAEVLTDAGDHGDRAVVVKQVRALLHESQELHKHMRARNTDLLLLGLDVDLDGPARARRYRSLRAEIKQLVQRDRQIDRELIRLVDAAMAGAKQREALRRTAPVVVDVVAADDPAEVA